MDVDSEPAAKSEWMARSTDFQLRLSGQLLLDTSDNKRREKYAAGALSEVVRRLRLPKPTRTSEALSANFWFHLSLPAVGAQELAARHGRGGDIIKLVEEAKIKIAELPRYVSHLDLKRTFE
ncbi:hypothetical protein HDV00_011048 [Rhizophlyctis rosea]|nr:hypothetical protein HDV00_011048 [Rhizophlyctis rosea]